jgi:hypothetical protein
MMNHTQPWKTKNWFAGEWNDDEAAEGVNPPEKVRIHDITLRDGEQQAGIIFTEDDDDPLMDRLKAAVKRGVVFGI